ncbi:hypothetical protein KAR48_01175 [bacterium]|nr:hypothetical protein [bacterium]
MSKGIGFGHADQDCKKRRISPVLFPNARSGDGQYNCQTSSVIMIQHLTKQINPYYPVLPLINQYELNLIAGREFNTKQQTDQYATFIINRAAVEEMGWTDPKQALGRKITVDTTGIIIGVVENFHYKGLQNIVEPLALQWVPNRFKRVTLSVNQSRISEILPFAEELWNRYNPNYPFEYYFLDEAFNRQYKTEEQQGRLFSLITMLGIVIATLGLFGLAAFMAERRIKEIGIRKVLGAGTGQLIIIMTSQFLRWVMLANVLAWPIAILGAQKWLDGFAYRITLTPWLFLGAMVLALLSAAIATGFQAVKAALANPVKSLKCE